MPPRKRRGHGWSRAKKKTMTREKPEDWQDYLQRIYFDPAHPGSFKGAQKLYEVVKEEGKYPLSLQQVRQWLQKDPSYSMHKPLRRKFQRLPVIVTGLHDQYEADLADMQKLKRKNDDVTFLLVVVDVFSRYMWVEPLRAKTNAEMLGAFQHLFERAPQPRRLRTDRGNEFTSAEVEDYFDRLNIEHWTAHNDEMKASYAESAVRNLKRSLWGYMRKNKRYRYIDILQDAVQAYNNTRHRSTGMKPSAVTEGDVEELLWWHQYKPKKPYIRSRLDKPPRFAFKKGDHVRISHKAKTFERAYDEKWTPEIFVVARAFTRFGIRKYRLQDIEGEDVKGTFYEGELQRVDYNPEGSFDIERVLKKRGQGKQEEFLVQWRGWPPKFNSWVKGDQLINYRNEEEEAEEEEEE